MGVITGIGLWGYETANSVIGGLSASVIGSGAGIFSGALGVLVVGGYY